VKIACVIILFFAQHVRAQSWFPEDATWQHEYWNVGAFIGYTRMVAEGDTVLGDEQARVLRRETVAAFVSPPHEVSVYPRYPFFVHESGGLVRIWEEWRNAFGLLYDMNAVPGDQWSMALPYDYRICDTTSFVLVLDTGILVLNDIPLRWLAVERHYILQGEVWNVHADTVIERIGYTTGYFAPHDACNAAADGDDGRDLRCYTDDLVSYKRIQPWSCETLLGLDEELISDRPVLVPLNNLPRTYTLRGAYAGALVLQGHDALGRMGIRAQLPPQAVVDLSDQAPGVFLYRLLDQQGVVVSTGRLLLP
jgi:hypothetical protein